MALSVVENKVEIRMVIVELRRQQKDGLTATVASQTRQ
jgi:hypothetical protein